MIQFVLPKDHSSSVCVGGTDLRQTYEDEHLASQENGAGKTVLPTRADWQIKGQCCRLSG